MYNKKEKIIQYIQKNSQVTPHDLIQEIGIGATMIHRHLKSLVEKGVLVKQGKPPKVYYSLKQDSLPVMPSISIDNNTIDSINENFTLITPDGNEIEGIQGFSNWCHDRKFNTEKKAAEYVAFIQEYNQYKKDGIIDATSKLNQSFTKNDIFLDQLLYLHPHSLPVFGKTKIATWLFHGKQTQNRMLIKKVLQKVIPEIQQVINNTNPDGVAFVPPTVPRGVQFMKELQKGLQVITPQIQIEKIATPIMVQQKSLKDIQDRMINAENTMVVVNKNYTFKKVMIIDDFTGSGATLNILAKKIKQQKIAQEVIGLTITGSMNGFEVVKEI
jgi:hypoxanthine-guanine phosphoribosyltransferase/biotin operon repressor